MPSNLTEADEFTESVQVPDDGDDRNAASVETSFQALTNRTRNLWNLLEAYTSKNRTWTGQQMFANAATGIRKLVYVDAAGAEIKPVRKVALPITMLAYQGSSWGLIETPYALQSGTFGGDIIGGFSLPHDQELTAVNVGFAAWQNPDVVSPSLQLELVRHGWSDALGPSNTQYVGDTVSGIGEKLIANVSIVLVAPNDGSRWSWFLKLKAYGSVRIDWIQLTYNDRGPKSY
jgi:hypothetical protein